MADLTLDTLSEVARDAFYVTIGAGVLTLQKLQVQRVELTKALTTHLDEARGSAKGSLESARDSLDSVSDLVEDRVKLLEERLQVMEHRLETVLAQLEDKLPEQARDLVKQARERVGLAA